MSYTMQRLIVVFCAILLGFTSAVPVKEESGNPFVRHGSATDVPAIVEKTTEHNDGLGSTTEVAVEEKATENIKDFLPIKIGSCLVGSVPKLIKCFKPKTTNMNLQLKNGERRWPVLQLEDLPFIDEYWQWSKDWNIDMFWQTSANLWLTSQKFWQPSEFWKSYEEFWKSIVGVGQPRRELRWSNEEGWQPSQEDWQPSQEYWQPSQEYWQPSQEDWQSSQEYWQPSQEDWQPSQEYWQPSQEDWQPSQEYWPCCEEEQQPRKENSVEKERSRQKENHISIEFSLHLPLVCIAEAVVDFGKCVLDGKSMK